MDFMISNMVETFQPSSHEMAEDDHVIITRSGDQATLVQLACVDPKIQDRGTDSIAVESVVEGQCSHKRPTQWVGADNEDLGKDVFTK